MKQDIHSPPPVTWTGTRDFPLLSPRVDDFEVPAIVRSLCRRPRYGGFSDIDVSVGAHTLLCDAIWRIIHGHKSHLEYPYPDGSGSLTLSRGTSRRAVVIHDFSEAYISDFQRPLKVVPDFRFYRELEALYEARMERRWLGHGWGYGGMFSANAQNALKCTVKEIDNLALAAEVHYAMPAVLDKWGGLPDTTEEMRNVAKLFIDLSDEEAEHTLLQVCADTGVR